MSLFAFDHDTLSQLRRGALQHPDPRYRRRCQILIRGTTVDTAREVARQFCTNPSAVRAAKQRFDDFGLDGFLDHRAGNGRLRVKLSSEYKAAAARLLAASPREYGFEDTRWTRFTLARAAAKVTGVFVSPSTAARLMARLQRRSSLTLSGAH